MFKGNAIVLDIGSSKITALVGSRGVNNTFSVKAIKSAKYSGFESGVFFDLEELKNTIIDTILSIKNSCGKNFYEIFIGVPGEFVLVKTQEKLKAFSRRKKIKDKDLNYFYQSTYNGIVGDYKIIKISPLYFTINNRTKTITAKGQLAENIKALVSYYFCEESFLNIISSILAEVGITKARFLPISLAQAMYLMSPEVRDLNVFLADIGYITSTVSSVFGNGITFQKSFSKGIGHISAYLCQALDISFDLAEILLAKSNLSYNKNNTDYELFYKDELIKFPAGEVNSVIEYGLDEICEYMSVCLDSSNVTSDKLFLTGGGISTIRGGLEYVSRRLNINIEICAPSLAYFNKPSDSSVIALLDSALCEKENKR